jgi:ubiquinone/menaquinone biosynthesis C-methylase UbiE
VRIDTGDARVLPYADGSFDVVLSHWVVHNLDKPYDRLHALHEMLMVLRPAACSWSHTSRASRTTGLIRRRKK